MFFFLFALFFVLLFVLNLMRKLKLILTFHSLFGAFLHSADPPPVGLLPVVGKLRTGRKRLFAVVLSRIIQTKLSPSTFLQLSLSGIGKMAEVNWLQSIVLRCEAKLIQMEI